MTPSNLAIFREQYAPRTTRVVNTPDGTVTVYSALAVGVIEGKSRTIRALVCEEIGTEDRWFLVTLFVSGKYAQTVAVLGATSSEQAEEWVKRQFSYEYQGEYTSACSLASNGGPLTASADALQEYLDSAAAGVMDLPIRSADISAFEGKITDRPVGWNQDILISHATLADLIHELARRDKQGMMMDAMTADDLPMLVSELGGEVPEFDAIIVDYNRLELMQERLMTAMHRAAKGMDIAPVTVQQTKPFKRNGVTNVAVMYEMSDGQTITIVFHSPDATPAKLGPRDTLTSWKWMLNKRDVTAAVAPENGQDVQLPVLAKRVMMVTAKNSARFKRTNSKKAEQMQELAETTFRIEQKTATLESINAEIESLQKQVDAGAAAPTTEAEATTMIGGKKILAGPVAYSRKIAIPKSMVSGSESTYYITNGQTSFQNFRIYVADSGYGPHAFVQYQSPFGAWEELKGNALGNRYFEPVAAKARELWDEYMAKQDQGDLLGSDESPDAKPANDGRLTPDTAANLKRGDVVTTADGKEFLALGARHDWLEVAPIVNGKAQVNNQDTFKFLLTPEKASSYPERRNEPVYPTGRNLYAEQEKAKADAATMQRINKLTDSQLAAFAISLGAPSATAHSADRAKNWLIEQSASGTDLGAALDRFEANGTKGKSSAEMAGGAGDDMQEYLSTALQDALFDAKAPDDFGAVFDPEVQNPRYQNEGKMSGFLVRQDRAAAADSDLVELMLTVSSDMTGTVTPYYGKNGKPGAPVSVNGADPASLGDALTAAAKKLLEKSADAPVAAGKPVSSAASKKFDRMIKIAADSVETLRPVDLDRVFDEAKSPDEMLELAKYIAAKRPEMAGRVESYFADVLNEKGWNKAAANPPQPPAKAPDNSADAAKAMSRLFKAYGNSGVTGSATKSGYSVRVTMTTPDRLRIDAILSDMGNRENGSRWVIYDPGSSTASNVGESMLYELLDDAVAWLNGNQIAFTSRLFNEDPKWAAVSGTDAPWRAEIAAAGKPAASQQAASAGDPQDWHTEVPTEGLPMLPKERDNTMPSGLITARIATDAVKAITQTQKLGNVGLLAHYLPSELNTGKHGIVRLFPNDQKPGGKWKLLDSQVFRIGMMTDSQIKERILEKLKSAPVLGYVDQPAAAAAPEATTAANPDQTMLEGIISGTTSAADVDMDALIAIAEKYDGNPDMEGLVNQALEVVTQYELEAAKAIG